MFLGGKQMKRQAFIRLVVAMLLTEHEREGTKITAKFPKKRISYLLSYIETYHLDDLVIVESMNESLHDLDANYSIWLDAGKYEAYKTAKLMINNRTQLDDEVFQLTIALFATSDDEFVWFKNSNLKNGVTIKEILFSEYLINCEFDQERGMKIAQIGRLFSCKKSRLTSDDVYVLCQLLPPSEIESIQDVIEQVKSKE